MELRPLFFVSHDLRKKWKDFGAFTANQRQFQERSEKTKSQSLEKYFSGRLYAQRSLARPSFSHLLP